MLTTVLNGRPTKPQVDKFVKMFQTRKEGDIISHEEIETAIGVARSEDPNRYRTIVQVAKKRILAEHGVYLIAAGCGQGYRIPTGMEQLSASGKKVKRCVSGISRAIGSAAVIADERLDEKGQAARDFYVSRGKELALLARKESQRMRLSCGSTPTLPK